MRIRTRGILISFSRGLTQAATIIQGIVLIRLVDKEIVGTFRQVHLVYGLIVGFLALDLSSSLFYFVPKLGPGRRRSLLAQTFAGSFATAVVAWAVLFFASGIAASVMNNPRLALLLRIFSFFPFMDRFIRLVPYFLISMDRVLGSVIFSIAEVLGRVLVTLAAFALGMGLAGALRMILLQQTVVAICGLIIMVRLSSVGRWRFDKSLIMEQWHYTWPLFATALVWALNVQFDKLLISAFFDPALYAVYSCGAMELPVVALITVSMSPAIMPNLVSLANEGKLLAALNLWQEAARKCSLIIFPTFVFFMGVSYDFIILLFGQAYSGAVWPFRVYLLLLVVRVAIYAAMFRALGNTKPIAIATIVGIAGNIILSLSLSYLGRGTLLGFVGPSVGAVASIFLMAAYSLVTLSRLLKVPFGKVMRWKELALTMLTCVACGVIVMVIPLQGLGVLFRLIVQAALFVPLAGAALWVWILKKDEKDMVLLPFTATARLVKGLFRPRRTDSSERPQ